MFIDLHCHLDFLRGIENIVKRASRKKVKIIVCNGVNAESNAKVLKLTAKYKEVRAALGLYPIDALKLSDAKIEKILQNIRENKEKIVAIGEVGIDFKEDEKKHDKQIKIFEKVIDLAIEIDKPLIVHSRKAEKEVIELLEKKGAKKVVMHCFSGSMKLADKIRENGWYVTIPTSVKHTQHFQLMIEKFPIEQVFCETDSPYLHPNKERNNEPGNVIASYQKIAEIKKMKIEDVEEKIKTNYDNLFELRV